MRGSLALAALIVILLPGAARAEARASEEAESRTTEFTLPATHGYRISVSGTSSDPLGLNVWVEAAKGQRYAIRYMLHGTSSENGRVKAKLPGVGRIAVRFEERKVGRRPVPDNCKGRPEIVRRGVFRGTIKLRGEQGYTSTHRSSARGEVTESFRQACDEPEPTGREPRLQALLLAGGEAEGRMISFGALKIDFGRRLGKATAYSASSTTLHDGMIVRTDVLAKDDGAGFSTPGPSGNLENATVKPPRPFTGSATFHLDSPRSSSWEGTLSVEMPGIGEVPLAGPEFWSALCEDGACTKTSPLGGSLGAVLGSVQGRGRLFQPKQVAITCPLAVPPELLEKRP
jgi:hypothetical protein